jgi:hypothetical protein
VLSAAILAATALTVLSGWRLPLTLEGLRTWGPYAAMAVGVALAWWFNRGRAFVAALSIFGALIAWNLVHTKAVYTLLTVLVPLNILLAMLRTERGARYRASYGWFLILAVEALAIYFTSRTTVDLSHWALKSPPIPLVGRVAFSAAFAAAVWRAWPDYKPLPVGLVAALTAFFIAEAWGADPGTYAAFMTAAGLILVASLLQESHQLAFRDPLTGLPGRRALEERLIYVARTRNGFTPSLRAQLMQKFRGLEVADCPFANLPEKRSGRWGQGLTAEKMQDCRWLRPVLVGQFEFREWTSDHHLRHSRFVGLREDKKAGSLRRETVRTE